jgi:16S rRNA (cytidine1402-2'-O)-methyltransferase
MMLDMSDILNPLDTFHTHDKACLLANPHTAGATSAHVLAGLAQDMQRQSLPPATLYVLATPIGNRADMTVRAAYVLHIADVVAAEDTRVAGHFLHGLGLHKPLLACDAHREQAAIEGILTRLAAGERVVLCSDAGTPAISDPGARLVAAVHAAGYRVLPIPGVSSLSTAISVSGLVGANEGSFTFHAFAPSKGKSRTDFYAHLCTSVIPQLWFEAPHRMSDAFELIAKLSPNRTLCIARELTKQFESIVVMPCFEAPAWLVAKPERSKGEFVLTLGAQAQTALAGVDAQALLLAQQLAAELPASKAAALAAAHYGANRSAIYAAVLAAKAL